MKTSQSYLLELGHQLANKASKQNQVDIADAIWEELSRFVQA